MNINENNKMCVHFFNIAYTYYEDITHPLAVAESFEKGSDGWIVGLYHDILEDTLITVSQLEKELQKFNKQHLLPHIVKLTRKPKQDYGSYLNELVGIELEVKIKDMSNNLSRTETLTPSLEKKYSGLLPLLKNKLEKEKVAY